MLCAFILIDRLSLRNFQAVAAYRTLNLRANHIRFGFKMLSAMRTGELELCNFVWHIVFPHIVSRLVTRCLCEPKPHAVLLGACVPSRHRRGRKTETSSDASREAPERAQKDTPKEANCLGSRTPLMRLSCEGFSGFHVTLPMSAGAVAEDGDPPTTREICFAMAGGVHAHSARTAIVYHKFRPADEKTSEEVFPDADLPGLSKSGICPMAQ